jgi:hypothetical protein
MYLVKTFMKQLIIVLGLKGLRFATVEVSSK